MRMVDHNIGRNSPGRLTPFLYLRHSSVLKGTEALLKVHRIFPYPLRTNIAVV